MLPVADEAPCREEDTCESGPGHGRPVIGFIAPNVHGYFFGSLLTGVIDTATANGARVVAIQTHDAGISVFEQKLFAAELAWDHLDALVIPQAAVGCSYLRAFAATGRPVVTVYEAPEGFACPTVVPDNGQGVQATVDHLVGHGHTAIAFVGREPANADDWIRYEAYREAMLANGLVPSEAVLVPWRLDESYDGAVAVHRLRTGGEMPTAVVACTDVTAMALIEALAEVGVGVPDDVAVVGFDDITEAAEYHPPLSTVAQSFTLAGATACAFALRALAGDPVEPGLHCTPVTFVARESCGCRSGTESGATNQPGLEDLTVRFVSELGHALTATRSRQPRTSTPCRPPSSTSSRCSPRWYACGTPTSVPRTRPPRTRCGTWWRAPRTRCARCFRSGSLPRPSRAASPRATSSPGSRWNGAPSTSWPGYSRATGTTRAVPW